MSFRYHLTSLAAVLLALAVGIVVGTTSAPSTTKVVPASPAAVSNAAEDFAERVQARLIANALTAQRVLLLVAPDAPSSAPRAMTAALKQAGATVTAQLQLSAVLLDPSGLPTVQGVVDGVAPKDVTLPTGGLERAGVLLADALVTSQQGKDVDGADGQKVVGGFLGGRLLSIDGAQPAQRATLVLILSGPARGPALATLAGSFETRVGTVVSATAASARGTGVVATLRAHATGASDVDGLGGAENLVGTVLALAEQANGNAGHYGSGLKATAVVPDLG